MKMSVGLGVQHLEMARYSCRFCDNPVLTKNALQCSCMYYLVYTCSYKVTTAVFSRRGQVRRRQNDAWAHLDLHYSLFDGLYITESMGKASGSIEVETQVSQEETT